MKKKKKVPVRRKPIPPRMMSTEELCYSLAGIAAFHVEDDAARMKIYETMRRLQMLDKAAIEAGLIPSTRR